MKHKLKIKKIIYEFKTSGQRYLFLKEQKKANSNLQYYFMEKEKIIITKTISARVPIKKYDALIHKIEQCNRSVNAVINELITQYINDN